MKNQLLEGPVGRGLVSFAVPIFCSNLLQAMYGTVDLMVVGRFADAEAVSAVSTGSMTMQTITGMIVGLTMGSTVLLGQNMGKKDIKACAETIGSALTLFFVIGLCLMGITVAASGEIAVWMNAPEEALVSTIDYLKVCGGGLLFVVLFNAISGLLRGSGDSKTPFVLVAIACVGNILGDLLLVGIFRLGALGAALATVMAQAMSVLCAGLLVKKRGLSFVCPREYVKPKKQEIAKILRYGLPIAAQDALTGVSFMVILAILNGFGLVASAGVGVAEKICALMFIVPGAMMSAVSVFSAQNIGAGNEERAKRAMYVGMLLTTLCGLCMFFLTFTEGIRISGLFAKDWAVCQASADYLRSYSVDCVIVGINFCMMGYLNGHGKTGFVALQGILSTFLVRIPVSYVMSLIPDVSLFQVGFATPLATVFAILITVPYLHHCNRKKKTS